MYLSIYVCIYKENIQNSPFVDLSSIQNSKMNPGLIRTFPHHTSQRIHFAYQMPFANPPNAGIATQFANGADFLSHQGRFGACPCGRGGGLTSSMSSTYNDDIVIISIAGSNRGGGGGG